MAPTTSTPTLPTIPPELLLSITAHLDCPSILSLSSASRALYQTIDPHAAASPSAKTAFFHSASRLAQHAD